MGSKGSKEDLVQESKKKQMFKDSSALQRRGYELMEMYIKMKFPFCFILLKKCFSVALMHYNNNLNIKQK